MHIYTNHKQMKKLLTLSLLLASLCSYSQKVKLALNLEKDSIYYLSTNARMDIDQLINGCISR
ncbi:hypothetical protein A0256_10340 [Mucilaginibacter sp. PAMC 26640]|nr:hypothetical protein A0256_10340 [Mucilaginibacter sp. PAMC 26640]